MKTTKFVSKKEALAKRRWFLFDAKGKILGRFACEVAKVLQGKHKTDYTPNIDTGDGVVIVNADQIQVTGMKEKKKIYRRYTGYIGGLRETPYHEMKKKKPTYILEHAIRGMMPKNRLSRHQMKKLHIYAGETHNQQAQKPIAVNI